MKFGQLILRRIVKIYFYIGREGRREEDREREKEEGRVRERRKGGRGPRIFKFSLE